MLVAGIVVVTLLIWKIAVPLVGWFILLLVAPFALLKSWASEPEPEFSQSFRSAAYQDYVAALVATPREDYLATKETP